MQMRIHPAMQCIKALTTFVIRFQSAVTFWRYGVGVTSNRMRFCLIDFDVSRFSFTTIWFRNGMGGDFRMWRMIATSNRKKKKKKKNQMPVCVWRCMKQQHSFSECIIQILSPHRNEWHSAFSMNVAFHRVALLIWEAGSQWWKWCWMRMDWFQLARWAGQTTMRWRDSICARAGANVLLLKLKQRHSSTRPLAKSTLRNDISIKYQIYSNMHVWRQVCDVNKYKLLWIVILTVCTF